MWFEVNKGHETSDAYNLMEEFVIDNFSLCTVREVRQKEESEIFYSASVMSVCGDHCCFLNDEDLETLKLKCLIKAKEFGWDIKQINLQQGI